MENRLPVTFWIIAVVATLWNLLGVVNFLRQSFMSEEMVAQMPEAQQEIMAAYPSWMYVLFGIAVIGGLLGSIGLLLRKLWCAPLLLLSLLAAAIQMAYYALGMDIVSKLGPGAAVMPIVVIAFAAFLLYYARRCRAQGWLS